MVFIAFEQTGNFTLLFFIEVQQLFHPTILFPCMPENRAVISITTAFDWTFIGTGDTLYQIGIIPVLAGTTATAASTRTVTARAVAIVTTAAIVATTAITTTAVIPAATTATTCTRSCRLFLIENLGAGSTSPDITRAAGVSGICRI